MLLRLRQEVGRSQNSLQSLTDILFVAVESVGDSSPAEHGGDLVLVMETQARDESHGGWFGKADRNSLEPAKYV